MHLTLNSATKGAHNITHGRYSNLRLRTQYGRCFVLAGRVQLACGTSWEQALEQLTVSELHKFAQKHSLCIPATEDFVPLAELFINAPDQLITKYTRQAEGLVSGVPVNPPEPFDSRICGTIPNQPPTEATRETTNI